MAEKLNLREIELFAGLTDSQFDELKGLMTVKEYKKGSNLFQTGEKAEDIFVLLDGKVSIQVKLSSRPEIIDIVMLSKKGQLIGWSGLMGESYYTASGICQEASTLLQINGQEFMNVLLADKEASFMVLQKIMAVISTRLRNLQSVVLKTM